MCIIKINITKIILNRVLECRTSYVYRLHAHVFKSVFGGLVVCFYSPLEVAYLHAVTGNIWHNYLL